MKPAFNAIPSVVRNRPSVTRNTPRAGDARIPIPKRRRVPRSSLLIAPFVNLDERVNTLLLRVPCLLVSESNAGRRNEHWATTKRRHDAQSKAFAATIALIPDSWWGKVQAAYGKRFKITLTRIGIRKLDRGNLEGCFKRVQDDVSRFVGIDDGSPRIEWRYEQRKEAPRTYGCEIKIESRDAGDSR